MRGNEDPARPVNFRNVHMAGVSRLHNQWAVCNIIFGPITILILTFEQFYLTHLRRVGSSIITISTSPLPRVGFFIVSFYYHHAL